MPHLRSGDGGSEVETRLGRSGSFGPLDDVGQRSVDFRRGHGSGGLNQGLAWMSDAHGFGKNGLAGMKGIRTPRSNGLGVGGCGLGFCAGKRKGDFRKIGIRGNVGEFDTGRHEGLFGFRKKTPDREQKEPNYGDMPETRGEKRPNGKFVAHPIDSQIGIGGEIFVFRRRRTMEKIADARTEFVPGRAPIDGQIETRQASVYRELESRLGARLGSDDGRHGRLLYLGVGCRPSGGGCQTIEAERGVALFEKANAFETVEALGKNGFVMMLDDHKAVRSDEMRGIEKFEDAEMLVAFGVGRIEKNEIGEQMAGGEDSEGAKRVVLHDGCAFADVEREEIFAYQASRGRMRFSEEDFAGAAAESFDADCTGASEEVDEEGAFDGRAENVEESFAESIAGGTEAQRFRTLEAATAKFSGDDAHG